MRSNPYSGGPSLKEYKDFELLHGFGYKIVFIRNQSLTLDEVEVGGEYIELMVVNY
jgi:hypothetical protein